MRTQIMTYIVIAAILFNFLVICDENLKFLQDLYNLQLEKIIETGKPTNPSISSGTAPTYDSYVLSVQWGNTLCLQSDYCKNKIQTMKRNVFTLHGLWPNLTSGKMLPDCNTGQDFPVDISDKSLSDEMKIYWPSYTGANEKFWQHEYNKHGFCYTSKTGENQTQFFSKGMEIFTTLKLEDIVSSIIKDSSKEEIAVKSDELRKLIDQNYSHLKYDFDCGKYASKTYLKEIRVYFDINFNPSYPSIRRSDCPASQPIYISKFNK